MEENIIIISAQESGERLDALLARSIEGLSRSAAQRLIDAGLVTCAGRALKEPARRGQEV